jgi:hypothetical protein
MIDNLEQIEKMLEFSSETFYHVQVIKRRKENAGMKSNSITVKTYYIDCKEKLDDLYPEMKCLAAFHNARVMINLNRRSYEKLAYQNLIKVTNQIMNKDYKGVKNSYNSVAGDFASEQHKKWIVDIDTKDNTIISGVCEALISTTNNNDKGCIIYGIIPTKNGVHIITSPFRLDPYITDNRILVHDVHKDNPTILYIPLMN